MDGETLTGIAAIAAPAAAAVAAIAALLSLRTNRKINYERQLPILWMQATVDEHNRAGLRVHNEGLAAARHTFFVLVRKDRGVADNAGDGMVPADQFFTVTSALQARAYEPVHAVVGCQDRFGSLHLWGTNGKYKVMKLPQGQGTDIGIVKKYYNSLFLDVDLSRVDWVGSRVDWGPGPRS